MGNLSIISSLARYVESLQANSLTLAQVKRNMQTLADTKAVKEDKDMAACFKKFYVDHLPLDDISETYMVDYILLPLKKALTDLFRKRQQNTMTTKALTGGSVDYYKLHIKHPIHFPEYYCECGDIIEALGMTFNEGEAFKAIWRRAAARLGNAKENTTSLYDAEKLNYYSDRVLANEIHKPSEGIFDLSGIEDSM